MVAAEPGVFEPHWVQRPGTSVLRVHRPATLRQALQLLADDPTRRLVAGGTDLVVELDRESGPAIELIDVGATEGSSVIDRSVRKGRSYQVLAHGVTHSQVTVTPGLVERAFPLAQACLEIGSPQLRNRATVAGNIATASPANDSISALMALDAELRLVELQHGEIVERFVSIADFFLGVRSTVLQPGEMIASVWVPEAAANQAGIWVKAGLRKAQAISVVHCGIDLTFAEPERTSRVVRARIALGSVAPTVVLSPEAVEAIVGKALDEATIDAAARAAAANVRPIDDGRATADYRSATVETVVRRALRAIAAGDERARWPERLPTLAPRAGSSRQVASAPRASVDDSAEVTVAINGAPVAGNGAASATLLDWLREHAGTGTKEGCAEGECGACTVMLDGAAVMSCLTPAAQAAGGEVTTVEGLADDDTLSAMQQSFVDNFAVQCGYCIPGFVVSATALCEELDDPTREEIELGLSGNLCRCTGYYAILEAVRAAGAST